MNDACTLWCFHATFKCPSTHFLDAGSKIGGQPEQVVGGSNQKGHAGVFDPKGFQIFGRFLVIEINQFGLNGCGNDASA